MLFRTKDLEAIFSGQCTLAFRRWKKPTVKPGGSERTASTARSTPGTNASRETVS